MPLWPAVKMTDTVIGLDFHTTLIPPSPSPIPWVPHPYIGPIYLWSTPTFPKTDVFINNMPACTVGSMGYFLHIPHALALSAVHAQPRLLETLSDQHSHGPGPGRTDHRRKPRHSGHIRHDPQKAEGARSFIDEVTGIDTTDAETTWNSVKGTFAAYTKWSTWVKLLMPPIPYPGAQGSAAVGSPNVTVNGGTLAFVAPLVATSCSDLPFVPNAMTLGFSNVMVGVSFGDIVKALLVNAVQDLISEGLQAGVNKMKNRKKASC